ncbi:MAG: hypothetical protein MJZ42_03355 [Bacteroidales bacterium]|nr:hypothetical protein [Bacteroidales bacterium]
MKKSRYILALVAAMFVVGAILFVACGKENATDEFTDSNDSPKQDCLFQNKTLIDSLAIQMGRLHNYELIKLMHDPNTEDIDFITLCKTVENDIVDDCIAIGEQELAIILSQDYDTNLMNQAFKSLNDNIIYGSPIHFPTTIDESAISKTLDDIFYQIANAYWESENEEVYRNSCNNIINNGMKNAKTLDEYFFLRCGASILNASFDVWVELLYDDNSQTTKEPSGWEKLKNKVKKAAKDVKEFAQQVAPYVDADIDGMLKCSGAVWYAGEVMSATGVGAPAGGAIITIAGAVGTVTGSVGYGRSH